MVFGLDGFDAFGCRWKLGIGDCEEGEDQELHSERVSDTHEHIETGVI